MHEPETINEKSRLTVCAWRINRSHTAYSTQSSTEILQSSIKKILVCLAVLAVKHYRYLIISRIIAAIGFPRATIRSLPRFHPDPDRGAHDAPQTPSPLYSLGSGKGPSVLFRSHASTTISILNFWYTALAYALFKQQLFLSFTAVLRGQDLNPARPSKTRPPQPNYRPGPAGLRLQQRPRSLKSGPSRPGREPDRQSGVFEVTTVDVVT